MANDTSMEKQSLDNRASASGVEGFERTLKELEDIKFALDASAIVAATDARGVITYANDKFCAISKYSRSEIIGRTHSIVNSGYHSRAFFADLWKTIESGKVWKGDIRNRAKDGTHYWVATTIVPFLDERGRPYQYLAIRTEITSRKRVEEALESAIKELAHVSDRERLRAEALEIAHGRLLDANHQIREEQGKLIQAEKLSSIGLLAAGVAHEVNNPLAGVMACVKALHEGTVSEDRREEYFGAIAEGLSRIKTIVQGLLDFSRVRPGTFGEVDLGKVLQSCLLLLAPQLRHRRVEIDVEFTEGERVVWADQSQLQQAIMNVLLNAISASPPSSEVIVSADMRDKGWCELSFRDQGPGIPPELISKVCDPFFTTKAEGEGTGLGLAVTHGIIQSHGGELRIESPPGGGALITFRLPQNGHRFGIPGSGLPNAQSS